MALDKDGSLLGHCRCGCGQTTALADQTNKHWGYIKGEPRRFVRGHNNRTPSNITPSASVLHLIESSLLGDGSLSRPRGRSNPYYVESHTARHDGYVASLERWLGNCARNTIRLRSGKGSLMLRVASRAYPCLLPLREKWYGTGVKAIPEDLAWMDDFTIAKWYMDDGSLAHNGRQKDHAVFSTNGFTSTDAQRLAALLSARYRVSTTVYDSRGPCLRVNAGRNGEIDVFWQAVSPHVVESMRYKLPESYRSAAHRDYAIGHEVTHVV